MPYLAIVKAENNRITKYQDFELKSDADAHIGKYGGFTVETPASGSMNYWVVNEEAKTITHDSSTEAADKAEYNASQYSRDRQAEYPSIEELVVALYDSEDKAEIDRRRAEVKNKYPKP